MYKIVNTISSITFLFLLFLIVKFEYSAYILLPFFLVFLLITFIGSYFIQLNYFTFSFSKKNTKEKKIALTFDDGPSLQNTPEVLKLLEVFGMKATFFVIGKKVLEYPEIVKSIYEKGHTVGQHSFYHSFWFDFYSTKKVGKEIQDSMHLIKQTIGKIPLLFRPPYGVTNPAIAKAIKKNHIYSIGWNIRTMDTVSGNSTTVLNRIKRNIKPGSVILLHDTIFRSPEILEDILLYLQENQYQSVTINELFEIDAYA